MKDVMTGRSKRASISGVEKLTQKKEKSKEKSQRRKGNTFALKDFASGSDDDMTWLSDYRAIRQWFDLQAMLVGLDLILRARRGGLGTW
jgi:hypothetical protein